MTICGEKVTGVCIAAKCPHIKRCCPVVWDKYGKIKPKTNEEWLRTATTEQLAEVLYKFFTARTFCYLCPEGDVCDIGYKCKYKSGEVEDFLEWLKQLHYLKE